MVVLEASGKLDAESQTEGLHESSIWKVIEMLVSTGRQIGGC